MDGDVAESDDVTGELLADEGMAERLDGADVVPEGWSAGVSSYPDGDGGDQAAFDVVDASGVIDAGAVAARCLEDGRHAVGGVEELWPVVGRDGERRVSDEVASGR